MSFSADNKETARAMLNGLNEASSRTVQYSKIIVANCKIFKNYRRESYNIEKLSTRIVQY